MELNIVHNMDCLEMLKAMPDNSIDSVVTDPPYGLSKEPNIAEVLTHWLNDMEYVHPHAGFMGKNWDNFVPSPTIWKEVYRVLKPGGHALVFAGTRTQDLMTMSLRLAGFEVRDVIEWIYFSGFPKSHDVSKAFDKQNGSTLNKKEEAENFGKYLKDCRTKKGFSMSFMDKTLGLNTAYSWWEGRKKGVQPPSKANYERLKPIIDLDDRFDEFIERVEAEREKIGEVTKAEVKEHVFFGNVEGMKKNGRSIGYGTFDITAPSTDLAKAYEGFGSGIKPAHEPILLLRKPLIGTIAENVEKHGTGGLNIGACRIGEELIFSIGNEKNFKKFKEQDGRAPKNHECETKEYIGRFPANCITLDDNEFYSPYFNITPKELSKKASKKDRNSDYKGDEIDLESKNIHPTCKPTNLMTWLIKLITPYNGIVLDPFAGSGSTLVAAKRLSTTDYKYKDLQFIGAELSEEYCEIINARLGNINEGGGVFTNIGEDEIEMGE